MELARKFVQEQFVTKGMIADLAFHSPEKEDGVAQAIERFVLGGGEARC